MTDRLAAMTLGLAVILGGHAASADYQVYTNRASFEAAITGEVTETFNELGPSIQSHGLGALSEADGLVTPIAVTSSNGTVLSASSTSLAGAYGSQGTYLLGPISTSSTDGLTVTLPPSTYSAAGADIGAFLSNSVVSYLVRTSDGETISGQVAVNTGYPTFAFGFLGVILSTPGDYVTSLSFSTPIGSAQNILLDNVSDGISPLSVPEPTSMVLAATGSLALGLTRLRRRLGQQVA